MYTFEENEKKKKEREKEIEEEIKIKKTTKEERKRKGGKKKRKNRNSRKIISPSNFSERYDVTGRKRAFRRGRKEGGRGKKKKKRVHLDGRTLERSFITLFLAGTTCPTFIAIYLMFTLTIKHEERVLTLQGGVINQLRVSKVRVGARKDRFALSFSLSFLSSIFLRGSFSRKKKKQGKERERESK